MAKQKRQTQMATTNSSTDKVLITVETQTDANDFCYCFVPEYLCKHGDITEIDPRICARLDKLKTKKKGIPTVIVRNFECKSCEPKKKWRIAGHSIRALSRLKQKDIYDVSYNTHDVGHIDAEKSGIYVLNSIDYSGTISPPSTNSPRRRKRFSLKNIWKWKRSDDDSDEDQRNGSVLRVQSFAYTPASRLQENKESALEINHIQETVEEQKPRVVRKSLVKDEEESNTLRMQKQFHSQPKLYKDDYKPLLHDHKSQSMHDMKQLVASVDSFDKFCAESPETSTTKRSQRKKKNDTQNINEVSSRKERKNLSRSNSNSSLKKVSKNKNSKSNSFSDKKRKKRTEVNSPEGLTNGDLFSEPYLLQDGKGISKRRPSSTYWNPTKVVAEIVEMERMQLLEEQRAHTVREGKTKMFTSYYDLQRASARDRQTHVDKEFSEYLMHQRKLLLATRESRPFDPLREGVAFDRLATPVNNDAQASKEKPRRSKPTPRRSTNSDSSSRSQRESRNYGSKNTSPNQTVNTNRSIRDRKSKTISGQLKHSNTDSPVSSKEGQRLSTDESVHSNPIKSTKHSSLASDSDLSVFALVPGTNLHRQLSLKGQADRAPVNIINKGERKNETFINAKNTLENKSKIAKRRTFSSVEDLISHDLTKQTCLRISLSADGINDMEVMTAVSARSMEDNVFTPASASARSKTSSVESFKFQPSVEKKLENEKVFDDDEDLIYTDEMYGTFV